MQPHDLIRAAAEIIKQGGWCCGSDAAGQLLVHARDHNGGPVPLFGGLSGDTSRAGVNGAAVSFSIYGALVKAMSQGGSSVANPGLMWDTMYRLAVVEHGIPLGGTNHVNPIIGYNEVEGRTAEEVLSFLETCALTLEPLAVDVGAE